MRRVRCAIYTRKSSEEGLEQDFNSLDAQREACEAYIASQRHEGWELLSAHYDDGGLSGGHLDRPALQRLMADVDAKQVDQIVVYKIDRLTRSLGDFAKLVERLNHAEASFVSVTQSFNTSTSMGRLTLNVLLSFAQFEREVTAERIRDKIAASKRRGLWMGGNVPLGYDPDGRTLKINDPEATTVRRIYELYEMHGTVSLVQSAAHELNLRSKQRTAPNGCSRGGNLMSRGQLHHILTNPIYAGRIRHKGRVFDGQHPAIIEASRWDAVQRTLCEDAIKPRRSKQHRCSSPLVGKLFDEVGEKLTSSHTRKGTKRYRYYISKKLVTAVSSTSEKQRTWRIPAPQLETLVASGVRDKLNALNAAKDAMEASPAELNDDTIWALIENARIAPGEIFIRLDAEAVMSHVAMDVHSNQDELALRIPFTERRRGVEMKMLVGNAARQVDQKLLDNIRLASRVYAALKLGKSFDEVASSEQTSKRRIQQIVDQAFLAPDIVRDITQGAQPIGLTSDWLLRHDMPADWAAQRERIASL